MIDKSAISFATIDTLGQLLASGRVSAVELAHLSLERLARLGPRYNAVASLTEDRGLEEARRADQRRRRGANGPLLGIPYGAKDLLAARGAPTRWGSGAFADQVLHQDAGAIERLTTAGSVLVAKLSMMELAAFRAMSPAASADGPGRNPWDQTRWAAGSSNGSAAAVAAGLVPFALASETGGSIGSPCAYCGVTGIRPTYGLVSRHGAMTLSRTLDKVGVMGRAVSDVRLVLDAIAGHDRRDATSVRRRPRVAVGSIRDLPGVRIGYSPYDFEVAATPSIRGPLADALQVLRDLGMALAECALRPDIAYLEGLVAIIDAEGASSFEALIESDRLDLVTDGSQRAGMRESLATPARHYLRGMRTRAATLDAFAELFSDVDLLVSYTLPTAATPIDADFESAPMVGGNTALVAASNLAGLPALFLPCGLDSGGLPVGIQLVGPRFSERLLFAVGEAFQASSDWHRLRPPVD